MCPPVPPAAITTFTRGPPRRDPRPLAPSFRRFRAARDVLARAPPPRSGDRREHADGAERDDRARVPPKDTNGQRDAGDRQEPRHRAEVHDRLQPDPRRDAGGEEPAERVGRAHRDPDARVDHHAERDQHDQLADQPELLAEHREDEVRVRVRQVLPLLTAGAEPDPEPSAGAERDQTLDQLIPVAQRVLPRVEERQEPCAAVRRCRR